MNVSDKHIKNYLAGKLSDRENYELEKLAQNDPLLQDAIEGYQNNPNGLNFYKKSIHKKNGSKLIIGLGAIAIVGIVFISFLAFYKNDTLTAQNPSPTIVSGDIPELEKMDSTINTFKIEDDLNTLKQETVSKEQKTHYPITQIQIPKENDSIQIDEYFNPNIQNLEIEKENGYSKWGKGAPYTFINELYVVDYREIKRGNTQINYTRMELSGTSAAFESEESESQKELVEIEVKIGYWEYLNKAIANFAHEDYKSALNQFAIIMKQYPEDLNALFYGGLCYFNFGKYEEAIILFDRIMAVNLNAFKEEAVWYSIKCNLKLGQKNKALRKIDEIIINGGFYTPDAIRLKKELTNSN